MDARAKLKQGVARAAVRVARWRGDPVAAILTGAGMSDPYAIYGRIRRQALSKSALGVYVTASYTTAAAVLRDSRFSSSPVHDPGYRPPEYAADDPRSSLAGPDTSLLTMDPPDHTRIRRLVASAFTRRATDALEAFVRETATSLLDQVDPHAGFDLVDSLAFPLPIAVICHLLGVPARDQDRFRVWGHDMAMQLEPRMAAELAPSLVASELELTSYLRDLIAVHRSRPDASLLSALVAAEEDGDRLSEAELVSTALLLLVAGFETTVNLISNGAVALMDAPEVWAQLRQDPSKWPDAVEELLRYDSPVQLTSRIATEEVELAGTVLPRGSAVIVAIGGANRDPEHFGDPDRVLLDRQDGSHLAFSLGIHHCPGASLARLEARVALEELSARVARLAPAGTAARRRLVVLRGYDSVPLRSAESGGAARSGRPTAAA